MQLWRFSCSTDLLAALGLKCVGGSTDHHLSPFSTRWTFPHFKNPGTFSLEEPYPGINSSAAVPTSVKSLCGWGCTFQLNFVNCWNSQFYRTEHQWLVKSKISENQKGKHRFITIHSFHMTSHSKEMLPWRAKKMLISAARQEASDTQKTLSSLLLHSVKILDGCCAFGCTNRRGDKPELCEVRDSLQGRRKHYQSRALAGTRRF